MMNHEIESVRAIVAGRPVVSWALLALGLGALACSGVASRAGLDEGEDDKGAEAPGGSSGASGGAAGAAACAAGALCNTDSEPVVMRRLTRNEYNNTVQDLLQLASAPARSFPAEELVRGFENNAKALSFPSLLAEQAVSAARELSDAAMARAKTWAPCAGAEADAGCARTFLAELGKRAWRRPLSEEEIARLMKVYEKGNDFEDGLGLATQAMFISVPFFYRVEKGSGSQPTPWEMASRLSYLLWNSLPDDELFARADEGKLLSAKDIEAAATRMLKDSKALRTFETFNRQWLQIEPIGLVAKDPAVFSDWSNDYAGLLRESAALMAADIAMNGKIQDLFTSRAVFLNDALAPYYGVDPPGSSKMTKVELADPARRSGFLSQGGMLASHAGFASTSPTFRGKFVREQFLCGVLPPPPPDVQVMIGAAPPGQTTREHYAEHIDNPQCAGCHAPMDPIGFAFEGYDAIGHPRSQEHGKDIDARGEASDTDLGTFDGLEELGQRLAQSEDVKACVARQWFRYAFGRIEGEADAEVLNALTEAVSGENTYRALVLKTVTSAAFRQLAERN